MDISLVNIRIQRRHSAFENLFVTKPRFCCQNVKKIPFVYDDLARVCFDKGTLISCLQENELLGDFWRYL